MRQGSTAIHSFRARRCSALTRLNCEPLLRTRCLLTIEFAGGRVRWLRQAVDQGRRHRPARRHLYRRATNRESERKVRCGNSFQQLWRHSGIGDTIMILPDAAGAATALDGARSSARANPSSHSSSTASQTIRCRRRSPLTSARSRTPRSRAPGRLTSLVPRFRDGPQGLSRHQAQHQVPRDTRHSDVVDRGDRPAEQYRRDVGQDAVDRPGPQECAGERGAAFEQHVGAIG
jgi:hypothetical protein